MIIETDYRALSTAGQDGLPLRACGGVVVIGNFDGVHKGHQALLAEGRALADVLGVSLVVLTFAPHPRFYFKPDQPPFLLSDEVLKHEFLEQCRVDAVVQLTFDAILSSVTAEEFIQNILLNGLQAKHVVVGNNFVFGHKRGGDVEMLQKAGREHGFAVTAMPAVTDVTGERISSERVRDALRHGRMASAEELLGRPWIIRGEVMHGDKRGRTIGFPTANVRLDRFLPPKFGIYAARVTIEDTRLVYNAAVSIGIRPMYQVTSPLLEAYLLDFDGDIYGKTIRIALSDFIRPEQKFMDLDELKAQIGQDVNETRRILQNL
jgi:riboflavin kinase / FMN adenylyltransferase